ncbi:MAG: hypothetical protein KC486_09120 [Myxococcales bacterium]|nr:hypothetical protein [Myxococcales bacterium]
MVARRTPLLALLLVGVGSAPAACGPEDVGESAPATAGTSTGASAGTTAASDGASSTSSTSSSSSSSSTASSTGDATSTSTTTTTTTTGDATTSTTGNLEPFVHAFGTTLRAGRLAFESNLPPAVDACLALPVLDPPCADVDEDGLVDAWEDAALDRLRPLRRMDEEEKLIDDADAVIADVGRVAPVGGDVRIFVMLGYHRDYGSCGGISGHNGDSERVALDLAPDPEGGPGGVVTVGAYTAAHEGSVTDHSMLFVGDDLDVLVLGDDPDTGEPRWVVFPSADKHATYATVEICEGISIVPCLDEDCAPDGVDDPAAYDLLPLSHNAGEENAPRLEDLAAVGFPGDHAWADQPFCGGLGPGSCSSAVREKLLVDPF